MTLADGSVFLDAQGAQNRAHFDRGIPRYIVEQMRALTEHAPHLLGGIGLNPARPLSGNLNWLLGSRLLEWSGERRPARGTPALYHVMSPFELDRSLDELWPGWARSCRVRTVVTLFDLIPLVFEQHYLAQPEMRARYMARAHLVRAAARVLAISQTTAADAVDRLGIDERRITVIGSGVSDRFAATYDADEPAWRALAHRLPDLRPGFVLYVSGIEFRKNNERLIEAYGRMSPEVRGRHQLVIACRMLPEARAALERHASGSGLQPGELVMPGYVSDAELAALYRLCRLFVFASFYEGSGLPMLEAMACGAAVAASATSTSPEILGDADATFDPFDLADIARCLEATVADDALLERLRARSRRRIGAYTWQHVAERSVEGYEAACLDIATRRPATRRRARLAWFTPWFPEQSGIASYNRRLLEDLGRDVDVDVVVAGPRSSYPEPREPGVRLVCASELDSIVRVRLYDRYVFCMGNSAFHRHVYEALLHRPGVVVAHDVRFVGFYGWYAGQERPEDPTARLVERIDAMYGARVDAAGYLRASPSPEEQEALGLFMTHEIQHQAELLLVHSHFAAEILRLDRPLERRDHAPISVIPHALEPRPMRPRPVDTAAPIIASFGVLSRVKGLATLIDAFAVVAEQWPGARLVLAGPGDPSEVEAWRRYAAEASVGDSVDIPGFVEPETYERLLAEATVAVQLRTVTNGEASGAVCDCLGAAVPTLATDLGWVRELPDDTLVRVPPDVTPAVLALEVAALLDDAARREALSQAAREYAQATTYARVARLYLEALGLAD